MAGRLLKVIDRRATLAAVQADFVARNKSRSVQPRPNGKHSMKAPLLSVMLWVAGERAAPAEQGHVRGQGRPGARGGADGTVGEQRLGGEADRSPGADVRDAQG